MTPTGHSARTSHGMPRVATHGHVMKGGTRANYFFD
jgi:hypothetical protein